MASTKSAPVRRGRRVALPPMPSKEERAAKAAQAEQPYVVAEGRDLRFRGRWVPPGVEIPGAGAWHRVEAWVSARRIRQVTQDEEYTPYDEWVAPYLEAEAEETARLLAAAEKAKVAEDAAAEQETEPEEE